MVSPRIEVGYIDVFYNLHTRFSLTAHMDLFIIPLYLCQSCTHDMTEVAHYRSHK